MAKETPTEDNRMQTNVNDAKREKMPTEDVALEKENVANVQREYIVNRILPHVGRGDIVKYVVHWYGYTQADDTVEPRAQIPEHFITSNWPLVRKQDGRQQG